MAFTQIIKLRDIDDHTAEQVREHIANWDLHDAADAPGYLGAQLHRDLEDPQHYLITVEFSSQDQATRNNERDATARWAEKLTTFGTPEYLNLTQVYRTGS